MRMVRMRLMGMVRMRSVRMRAVPVRLVLVNSAVRAAVAVTHSAHRRLRALHFAAVRYLRMDFSKAVHEKHQKNLSEADA